MKRKLLFTMFFAIALFSIWKISLTLYSYKNDVEVNESIKKEYYKEINEKSEEEIFQKLEKEEQEMVDESEKDKNKDKEEKVVSTVGAELEELRKINKDITGWIRIDNTLIDYPILKGIDNEFYLNHNVMKEKSTSASIFMDFRNDGSWSDRNNILYGHNMKNGTMFNNLCKYKNEDFFRENDTIYINTSDGIVEWKIFSAYVTDTDFYYIETDFGSDQEYITFLSMIKDKSKFHSDITLTEKDVILTLSTCTYEFNDARFVVHAKRKTE